jgi:hypothetical protein
MGPAIGDNAELRIWYSRTNNNSGNGINGNLSLIKIESSYGDELYFSFLFNFLGNENSSPFPVPNEGYQITIKLANHKPSSIISCSSKFGACPWITGVNTNFGMNTSQLIWFPLLPPERDYENKDWYSVRVNDSIALYCEYISGKAAFLGTFKKSKNNVDRENQVISTGDKYIIYTKNNPFRLGAIVVHSDIPAILQSEFKGIGEGYYGLKLGIYTPSRNLNNKRIPNDNRRKSFDFNRFDGQGRIVR